MIYIYIKYITSIGELSDLRGDMEPVSPAGS